MKQMRSPFFLICFAVIASVLFACQKQPIVDCSKPPEGSSPGAMLFKAECSKCHNMNRALKLYGDQETWRNTAKAMQQEHRADITDREIEELVAYHVERLKKEISIFNENCQQCHPGSRFTEKALTSEQIRATIKRMGLKACLLLSDADVELMIQFHIREHQRALDKNLRGALGLGQPVVEWSASGTRLFMTACTECHPAEKALCTIKDSQAWGKTITRMQSFSQGNISDAQVQDLVQFHVQEQRFEMSVFQETCTTCHPGEEVARHSMSAEESLRTVLRMQEKSPQTITDDKIEALMRFHLRQEAAQANLFEGRCATCHKLSEKPQTASPLPVNSLDALINLANTELCGGINVNDARTLIDFHKERERREMGVFEHNCSACHAETASSNLPRTMDEWIVFISTFKDRALDRAMKESIKTQIRFHVSSQKR